MPDYYGILPYSDSCVVRVPGRDGDIYVTIEGAILPGVAYTLGQYVQQQLMALYNNGSI